MQYFSNFSNKVKNLNRFVTNPISPNNNYNNNINKAEGNTYQQRTNNPQSSDHRTFKYKNCYILNNLNNYQSNVIKGNESKQKNENKNNKNQKLKNLNANNNISDNNSNNSKKTNGAPNTNNDNEKENNSLLQSTGNCLNTIAFPLSNIISNENSMQMNNCIRFNGLNDNGFNPLSYSNNKSINNTNDLGAFNSRNTISKKFKDKNNNIEIRKEINLKNPNNSNNIKRTALFKQKSKVKTKPLNSIYSNTTNTNTNNINKKSHKSSINNTNSLNTNNKNNENNKDININEKIYVDTNTNNTNSYSNINNKDLFFETVEGGEHFNDEYLNINNNMNNNKRNKDLKQEGILELKSLNSVKSFHQNNINNGNNVEDKNIDNFAYQTYTVPFRKNIIKVNMINKEKEINQKPKNANFDINNNYDIINNDLINPSIKNIIYKGNNGTKSSINLKTNLNSTTKKLDKKDLYINTDFKSNTKKNLNIINNNDINININQKEEEYKKELTSMNYKNNIICFNNTINSNKNSNTNSVTNTLNFNIYPLSRDNSKTYIKKKSSNINNNINNEKTNAISSTTRSSMMKHKKNYSISTSCYNSQRNKENKFNIKNKNNKNNYLYSPKKHTIENKINNNKTILIPEYKVKLDNIKSRVIDLLNIYSLLALRSINNSNENNINNGNNEKEISMPNDANEINGNEE